MIHHRNGESFAKVESIIIFDGRFHYNFFTHLFTIPMSDFYKLDVKLLKGDWQRGQPSDRNLQAIAELSEEEYNMFASIHHDLAPLKTLKQRALKRIRDRQNKRQDYKVRQQKYIRTSMTYQRERKMKASIQNSTGISCLPVLLENFAATGFAIIHPAPVTIQQKKNDLNPMRIFQEARNVLKTKWKSVEEAATSCKDNSIGVINGGWISINVSDCSSYAEKKKNSAWIRIADIIYWKLYETCKVPKSLDFLLDEIKTSAGTIVASPSDLITTEITDFVNLQANKLLPGIQMSNYTLAMSLANHNLPQDTYMNTAVHTLHFFLFLDDALKSTTEIFQGVQEIKSPKELISYWLNASPIPAISTAVDLLAVLSANCKVKKILEEYGAVMHFTASIQSNLRNVAKITAGTLQCTPSGVLLRSGASHDFQLVLSCKGTIPVQSRPLFSTLHTGTGIHNPEDYCTAIHVLIVIMENVWKSLSYLARLDLLRILYAYMCDSSYPKFYPPTFKNYPPLQQCLHIMSENACFDQDSCLALMPVEAEIANLASDDTLFI